MASRGGSSIRFPFVRILTYKLSQDSTPKRFGPISRRSRSASRSCRRAAFDGFATRWRIWSNLCGLCSLNRYSLNFGPTVVRINFESAPRFFSSFSYRASFTLYEFQRPVESWPARYCSRIGSTGGWVEAGIEAEVSLMGSVLLGVLVFTLSLV